MASDYFNDFQASLFSALNDLISKWKSEGHTSDMQPFKWDAHSDVSVAPETDLVGPMELSLQSNSGLQTASAMIAVSTINDTNIFRLDQMAGDTYARFSPDQTLPLIRASNGNSYGIINVKNGTELMPIMNTDIRSVRAIAVSLAADKVL